MFEPALALLLLAPIAEPGAQDEIRVEKNLVYASRSGVELKLDLASPTAGKGPFPGLILIHGGGWRAGSRAWGRPWIELAATRGYVAVTIQYRLLPEHPWPAAWEDVRAALGWMRSHAARLRLDPERIGALGASAGGHLALLLGTVDGADPDRRERLQAVVNLFGPSDLRSKDLDARSTQLVQAFLGGTAEERPTAYAAASPLAQLSPGDAAVISFHGSEDRLVPIAQSEALHAALVEHRVPGRLVRIEGAGHGWRGPRLERTQEEALTFLDSYLKGSPLPLLLHEDFESGFERWKPTDPQAWKLGGKEGGHFLSLHTKRSSYKPPVRSPFNIAWLAELEVGDMILDVRLRSTIPDYPHRDLCLFFGYRDPAHFYYVHLGKNADPHSNSIFLVDGKPRLSIATERTKGTAWQERWHRVRIRREVASGRIEVYFDDMEQPVMTATDRTFARGRIGIGSFDDTGDFDAIRVRGR